MQRVDLAGKGQALDGDLTTTGATCIASGRRYSANYRHALCKGDSTSECPVCGQPGIIAEGLPWFISEGREVAMDGALVECGCPSGSNRVVAPLNQSLAPASIRQAPQQKPATVQPTPVNNHAVVAHSGTQESGFYIVPRSMSGPEVLSQLFEQHPSLPVTRLKMLNPTFESGFKAGEIFVIGDPDSHNSCTREEAQLMAAAEQARKALASLTREEADFMMRHQAEIAGLLSDASLAMGVAQAMAAKAVEELQNTLRHIEHLHQQQFLKHGHLRGPDFFNSRKQLFQKLDAQLKMTFLNKHMNLGSHETLRRDLGISSKSLVHHWSKAGGPGQIPGYATHLEKVARLSNYLKHGGRAGVAIGGVSSVLKIQDVCRAGETDECKKVRFTETGSFAGGLSGGAVGGLIGKGAATVICLGLGPVSAAACGLVIVGASTFTASVAGMSAGETLGEIVYEHIDP
ncbi:PAAR domain-containing protein [Pseudomonas sp. NPDC089406]|uniref:PAAR domain-containing protein n=1 Tax=Pseudomonas sp. NPDC089406 TaxID=3364463 RepID=UPI00384CB13E